MVKGIDLLRSMDIFTQISEQDIRKIASLLKERRVARDEVIFKQGDPGDALYIVVDGNIKCSTTDAIGREKVLGFFTEGQFFGEMALLTGEPRSASMQAVGEAKLLTLRKDDFDGYLAHNVPVMLEMMKVIAQRQAATNLRLSREQGGAQQEVSVGAPRGKVFTVFSPKGGVGKTTLAVNLAVGLAHQYPEDVVLVDLSLTFGHTLLQLNLASKSSLASTSADSLSKAGIQDGLAYYWSIHPTSSLKVLPGSTRPEEGEQVSGDIAKVALEQLKKHFAYVVVDTGPNFADPVISALEASDRVILVCSPEISVVRDVRECQRIFSDVIHIKKDQILYVFNNIFPFKTLTREQFEDSLQQTMNLELPYSGDTPAKSALRGEAFVESQGGSAIAKAVLKLAAELTAEKARAGAGGDRKKGLFK